MTIDPPEGHAEGYSPLYDPERDGGRIPLPLKRAVDAARATLAEKGRMSIHDRDEMIRAAYGLAHVLDDLLNALDEEDGR